jgi:ATP-dependent Lon protease
MINTEKDYPLIALREVVLFPTSLYPLMIARPFSLQAARHSLSMDGLALFVAQKDPSVEEPSEEDIYRIGTIGKFLQHIVPPDGSIRAVIQGIERVKLVNFRFEDGYFKAKVAPFPQISENSSDEEKLARMVREYFQEFLELSKGIPEEVALTILDSRSRPLELANLLSTHLSIQTFEKQKLLEAPTLKKHLELLVRIIIREVDFLKLKQDIEARVRDEIRKGQRQFFLQQEMREIQKELGVEEEDEFIKLEEEINKSGMPEEVKKKALSELSKLRRTPPISPEATVIRNYLDWLLALPWNVRSEDNLDIKNARKVLDEDHYGLEEQKERILEYLSVLKLKGALKGQVICFVGPPGVGKTSLAKSIARALGRKFVRMSLGGLRDEAEIRGHRRTYVGALPGRIIQQIRRAGTKNPVFLFDEVDKIGMDYRGDPQAALMEVLDPEVNKSFQDHYLEVEFDLSEVLFITTANSLYGIPKPLLDRMEIIPLRGYLDYEKLQIARRHLIPKKMEEIGIPKGKIFIEDEAIMRIIREYTREAGVRELERQIAKILRKAAKVYAEEERGTRITKKSIEKYLGVPKYRVVETQKNLPVGVAYGLAWTEYGGEILRVEVSVMKGSGKLELTGHLGEIMKESAKAALSFIRSHFRSFGLPQDFYKDIDIHLHVPEGAIPKDGPSAGVALLVAMLSALTKTQVPGHIAMTGEITLSGEVLSVGGLEEKILAAKRSGIKEVYLPAMNKREVKEIKREILDGLEIIFIENLAHLVEKVFKRKVWKKVPPKEEGEYSRWISL